MKIAFLFPGQGMEVPRMGVDLARRHLPAMNLLLQTGDALGVNLLRLLERGGTDLLRTEVLQPALCAVSLGALDWLRQAGVTPALVAGHSLGEVAAWSATGAVCAHDAVGLAATRGRLMAREAERFPGSMLALVGAGPDDLARALRLGRGRGELYLAAHNAPDEWVLTGEVEALLAVGTFLPSRQLHSAGAWHCGAMSGAVDELRREMEALPAAGADTPMICNATGEPAPPERIPELLAGQLIKPVQWARTMETLGRAGVTDLVTVGPGKVLRGLARKNLGAGIRVHASESPAHLDRTLKGLEQS